MPRTLVIGYGNVDRGDDGAAYHVINVLRQRLAQPLLDEDTTGLEALGQETDSIFLNQLVPELMETAADYDHVIFVDAHVGEDVRELHCVPVAPEYSSSPFTHHMTPQTFLAMLTVIYSRAPAGHIVSLRGHDFDFHPGLSEDTEKLVGPAVDCILQILVSP